MAKIEMDISEYEAIKKTERVLEDALKREKDLQDQIKTLNEEKIKALEDAKMKIIKIKRTSRTECIYVKKSVKDIWRDIEYFFRVNYSGNLSHSFESYTDQLISMFFEKRTLCSEEPIEETITCGLDEIKSEIKQEIEKKVEEKLKRADGLNSLVSKLEKEIWDLKQENSKLVKANSCLLEENKSSINSKEKLNEIELEINKKIKWFSKSKVLSKIKLIINKTNE